VEVELSELHLVFLIMPFETLLELTGDSWGFFFLQTFQGDSSIP
jgi:hypothetical protein